jgi:hypothetical protein
VGSCWATPAGVPQYYNLHNDYEVGFIDRHTYFGGGLGMRPGLGEFVSEAQVDRPGSGLLSSGLLQVVDRPFAISEWTSVCPNEWLLESPAIFAAYGMGLQGWDASYHFASHIQDYKGRMFASRVNDPRVWVVDLPNQIGLYPVLARMVYRGDVEEAPLISTRRVSLGELLNGEPQWVNREQIKQSWDFKEYDGPVSSAALAAGRVVVEFVENPQPSDFPDPGDYVHDDMIRSVTGQLNWRRAEGGRRGYFTIDTDGTKAVVGFMPAETVNLGNVSFQSDNLFAGLFLTSLDRDKTIAQSSSLLLFAMARVRNTGQRFSEDGSELLAIGQAPIVIEPVQARFTIAGRGIKEVRLLDHDGRRTDRTLPVQGEAFAVDGRRDRTMYYEVVLE